MRAEKCGDNADSNYSTLLIFKRPGRAVKKPTAARRRVGAEA